MSSINTNVAANMALRVLTSTQADTQRTQTRIASGARVGSAQDNAAYWSIATTMRSDIGAMSAVKDALALASATAEVAYQGVNSVIKLVDQMKQKLIAARQPEVDLLKIQDDLNGLQAQMQSTVKAASFAGENWLMIDSTSGSDVTKSIVSSYSRDGANAVSIGTINIKLYDATTGDSIGLLDKNPNPFTSMGLLDRMLPHISGVPWQVSGLNISLLDHSPAGLNSLEDLSTTLDQVISKMTTAATTFGSIKSRIDLQHSFFEDLTKSMEAGVSTLVDADMNEESTRLQALQTKQSLGINALSIANQSSQAILRLFQ